MIDREQRSIARNIAVGRCPVTHEDASTKARAYGLFAKSVLARIFLNVAGEDMKAFQDNSVSGLVKAFADSVYAQGVAVINSMPHHDEEMLRRMSNARRERYDFPPSPAVAMERLHSGLATAVLVETVTFRTLAYYTGGGNSLTHKGLIASWRVPFLFAQTYQNAVTPALEMDLTEEADYAFQGEDDRSIFRASVSSIDPVKGLAIAGDYVPDPGITDDNNEPHLGCPVTLLPRFVLNSHKIMADAAVRNGIITVS